MKSILKKLFQLLGFELRRYKNRPLTEMPIAQQKLKTVHVGNFKLLANETHSIENHLKQHVEYSSNLPRIAAALSFKWADFNIIDIGANIGDTVALLRSAEVKNAIFCIEPVSDYFDLLKKNASQFSNIKLFNLWLDEFEKYNSLNKNSPLSIEVKNGTARLHNTLGKNHIVETSTLDKFVENQGLSNIKLLKIDTDGFDLKILRGGMNFIKQQKPVLFFEYDAVYLADNDENGWQTLAFLRDNADYDQALYYDNYGRFLCSFSLKNERQAHQFLRYIQGYRGAFPYFDVCLFHSNDGDLAERIIQEEEKRP